MQSYEIVNHFAELRILFIISMSRSGEIFQSTTISGWDVVVRHWLVFILSAKSNFIPLTLSNHNFYCD